MGNKKELSSKQREVLFSTLKARFEKSRSRRKAGSESLQNLEWPKVEAKLESDSSKGKLWSLQEMESTGGEPDVVDYDEKTGEIVFCDCAAESPKGRRSLCYDREGLESRKEHRPSNTAVDMAADMGLELLDEKGYRKLQELGAFDTKTSSWLRTPVQIRELGGAIFGDRRFDHVFIYHNGAQSYYGARGFRGSLRI